MPKLLETLGIDRLSVLERLDLIEQIWETLPDEVKVEEIPAWQLEEIKRRRAQAEQNPSVGQPWREALADLQRQP